MCSISKSIIYSSVLLLYIEPPTIGLLGFWELSGRQSTDDLDPASCPGLSSFNFPSATDGNEAQVIGDVTFIEAPEVVDHACAVMSDADGALDFGSYAGECASSPDHCPCGVTFALWVMPFDPTPDVTSDWFFLSTGGQSSSAHGIAFYRSVSDQSFQVKLRTSTTLLEAIVPGSEVSKETWSHFVFVFDQAYGIKVNLELWFDSPPPVLNYLVCSNLFCIAKMSTQSFQ